MPGHLVSGCAYLRTVVRTDVHDPVRLRSSTHPSVLAPRFKLKDSGLVVKG